MQLGPSARARQDRQGGGHELRVHERELPLDRQPARPPRSELRVAVGLVAVIV